VPAATTNNSFLGENIDSSGLNAAVRTVSADGNRIVFASDADGLSTEDDNRYRNVFVRDRRAQTTILVSRAGGPSGDAANDDSFEPTISADGTVVAFTTRASNLGDNAPANSDNKVYVRTIATGATKLVSRATGRERGHALLPGAGDRDRAHQPGASRPEARRAEGLREGEEGAAEGGQGGVDRAPDREGRPRQLQEGLEAFHVASLTRAGAPNCCSTSGTSPWKFSSTARAQRSVTAVPFSVCTNSVPPFAR
jgi:hypothetical protein